MDIQKISESFLGRINPRMATWLYNRVKNIPAVKQKVEKEFETLINELEGVVKPYRGQFDTFVEIPDTGRDKSDILKAMQAMSDLEQANETLGRLKRSEINGAGVLVIG